MSLITIDLKDILSQGVACEVIFRPKDTPFINGTTLTVNANRSVRTNAEGKAQVALEPGEYEVRLEGAGLYHNPIVIGVPDDDATYALTALINEGTTLPNPPQLQGSPGSQILSGANDPSPADGAVSDWWFNTATRSLFGPKTESGWPAQGIPLHGEKVELQRSASHIQWRHEGESTWHDLLPLTDVTGPQGIQGDPGIGIPAGGSDGQLLVKDGTADYAAKWAGTIPQSAVANLPADLAAKEPLQTAASQAEMETGTESGIRKYSPLRIWQAINKGISNLLAEPQTWSQNQIWNGTNNTLPNHAGLPPSITTSLNARQLAFESALQSLCSLDLLPHFAQTATANGGEALLNSASTGAIYLRPRTGNGGKARVYWNNITGHSSSSGQQGFLGTGSILLGVRFVFVSWTPAISKGCIRFIFGDAQSTTIPDYGSPALAGAGFGFEVANNTPNTDLQLRIFSRGSDNAVVYSNFVSLGINLSFSYHFVNHVLLEYNGSTGDLKLYHIAPTHIWAYPNRTPKLTLSNPAMIGVTALGGARVSVSTIADAVSPMTEEFMGALTLHKIGFTCVPS